MQRQQQIIHQHMASLSDQDRQKFTQMSSNEKHQYLAQRNLLITSNMQMQHTTIGKNLLFLTFPACFSIQKFFSNLNFNCSNLSSL